MKKFCFVVMLLLCFSLCSCIFVDLDTPKSAELSEKYSFYEDSVASIRSGCVVTPEEADKIFLVLVNECGIDKEITVTSYFNAPYSVRYGTKSLTMTLDDNVVSEVFDGENQIYPITVVSNVPASEKPENVSPSPTDFQQNADLALITQSNHPVLFSSTDDAHVFWGDDKGILGWKDRADKKISYPDTYSKSPRSGVDWGACILEMTGDMNFSPYSDRYIFGIHICFDRFEKPVNLKLNEALQLASSYLPHDTLNSYYKLNYSTSYKATKESDDNDCYYDISYSPINKKHHDFILNNNEHYEYPTINITLQESEKKYITNIWINLHQSMCKSGRYSLVYDGNYKEVKWDYDFLTK